MQKQSLALVLSLLITASTLAAEFRLGYPLRKHVSNELIVAFSTPTAESGTHYNQLPGGEKSQINTFFELKTLFSYRTTDQKSVTPYFTLSQLKARSMQEAEEIAKKLLEMPNVLWVEPNFIIEGDPRESFTINDPLFKDQKHHVIMENEKAWEINSGSKDVIVAITDDGVEVNHPDLQNGIWINSDEIPNNGIDDDGNGYIDDINGWDFSNDWPDVTPKGGHGTHLAGIINATAENEIGVVGTAPGVTLMPIKFIGGTIPWSSASIAKSYDYAIKNGAKIISTSYNVDFFASDRVYSSAVEYAYRSGLLVFNSAGNAGKENPPRFKVRNTVFVASTDTDDYVDRKSRFSNYGYGVNISAPGQNIYSTYPGGSFSSLSGTSMATPNAAAVAALIWSEYPKYSNDQVLARLTATCDNIDGKNSRYKNKLGAGRVNSFRALSEEMKPPVIKEVEGIEAGATLKSPSVLSVILKNTLLPEPINENEAFELIEQSTGNQISFTSKSYHHIAANRVTLYIPKLKSGKYLFRAKAKYLVDPFGIELDGNGDGISGDDYELPFEICTFCY